MIEEIRIFPPLAIARMGSSENPMENYRLVTTDDLVGYRELEPQPTLVVDGDHVQREKPTEEVDLSFKDGDRIRPVCPFFQVWARFDNSDKFVPLTARHLADEGVDPAVGVKWKVSVGNLKAFRRTGKTADKIFANTPLIGDFEAHELAGHCENFVGGVNGQFIPFGSVRYLRPTDQFPQIQLRFTPAAGRVYGPTNRGDDSGIAAAVYDSDRGTWHLHQDGDPDTPPFTNPGGIYGQRRDEFGRLIDENGDVILPGTEQRPVNLGYLDDACDGIVEVEIDFAGRALTALSRVSVGPPDFAPDSLPVRTVYDELEQMIMGAQVTGSASLTETADILRRAMETVRLMNTVVMNGPGGLSSHLRRRPDPSRQFFWIRSTPEQTDRGVDPRRVIGHHADALEDILETEEVLFDVAEFIRRPDQVGDLTDANVQRMPAMMRGSDSLPLALTRRQIAKLASGANGLAPDSDEPISGEVDAINLTAQMTRLPGSPNPEAVYPHTAIANCFPGLEFDFRNLWRRVLRGVVLHESSFLVVEADTVENPALAGLDGAILLSVDGRDVYAPTMDSQEPSQQTGWTNLEWANSLAHLVDKGGQQVACVFQVEGESRTESLEVRNLFSKTDVNGVLRDTAVVSPELLEPGELTQGLCSPWQADFRECGCYYWAASRPDFVNTEVQDGITLGHNWLLKRDSATPVDPPRQYEHPYNEMITYDDLYREWEKHLSFVIKGRDSTGS